MEDNTRLKQSNSSLKANNNQHTRRIKTLHNEFEEAARAAKFKQTNDDQKKALLTKELNVTQNLNHKLREEAKQLNQSYSLLKENHEKVVELCSYQENKLKQAEIAMQQLDVRSSIVLSEHHREIDMINGVNNQLSEQLVVLREKNYDLEKKNEALVGMYESERKVFSNVFI